MTLGLYTDRLSARPGDRVTLYASVGSGDLTLELVRIGKERVPVYRRDGVSAPVQATRAEPDVNGCGWSPVAELDVPERLEPGYYDLSLASSEGAVFRHPLIVRAPSGREPRTAVVLATNTLHAYNYWGGRSAYCDVEGLMARRFPLETAMERAIGTLSAERPFAPMLLAPPADMPRLVNLRPRGFNERTWAGADPAWSRAHRQSPYDGSAGFVHKWEHRFAAFAEAEGLRLDYLCDYDLEREGALSPYRCVVLVGHSEYWSGPQRDALEQFVDEGGGLAVFSGNTAFWKVRWEEDGRRLVCRKWNGLQAEDAAAASDPLQATHLWSHPVFARPEAEITGLSFLYGGYHRLGLCAARGAGGYTVYRTDHWALEGSDLYYGDVFGGEIPLVGYENDGCRFQFDEDNLPRPQPGLGVPANLEIIALAPAAFGEAQSPYRPLIPPEKLEVVAEIAYGEASDRTKARVLRGHAVMASFRRGRGEVFNAGTTEWAYGLGADPFVDAITRNVLRRFGAYG